MPSELDVIAATAEPVTRAMLVSDLSGLGIRDGDIVIAHTSLSSLGWVVGGAQTVVQALLESVGDSGTVVVPTQSSYLGDPSLWGNPPVPADWFETIRSNQPAYDAQLTATRGVGAVPECLRHHPGALRSSHPLASFAAIGPRAEDIVSSHALSPALGESSPLGRLYALDAKVLLVGVNHDRNTSLHLAEYRAVWPGKRTRREGAPAVLDGQRHWHSYEDLDLDDEDFVSVGEAFAAACRGQPETYRRGRVARADCRLMRQRALVDFATEWMNAHRKSR